MVPLAATVTGLMNRRKAQMKAILSTRTRYLIGLATVVVLAVGMPTLAQAGAPELHSEGSGGAVEFKDNTFSQRASGRADPKPEKLESHTTIGVVEYADDSFSEQAIIGMATYDALGKLLKKWGVVKGRPVAGEQIAYDSGSGGTSSAQGCHRVWAKNRYTTTLGFTAFVLHSWTDSCWNRSAARVNVYVNDAQMENVDSQYRYPASWYLWDGLFYDYGTNNGQPYSAFRFRAQKMVENCVAKYGCINTYYPLNILRSYYNGTWAWETS
jgi:hypothetical protein